MASYMQDYEVARLMAKAFSGTISSEEEKMLAVWREENPELYDIILDRENKKKRDEFVRAIEVDRAWRKVKTGAGIKEMGKKSLFRWTTIAASVVLCLGFGALLYWFGDTVQRADEVKFAGIEAGSSRAVLITSGGQEIILDDTTVRRISLEEGMVATNDGKKVMYHAEKEGTVDAKEEMKYNIVKVPRGGEYELMLSDHTKVRLNSATELRFPVRFDKNSREVYLEGEAFFSVTKDEKRPFIVKVSNRISVEVLGTEFNVMAYQDDDRIETTLNRGKVRVSDQRATVELLPDQQAVYDKGQSHLSTRQVDAENYSAWKDGKFIFENATLESIMTRLGRWYNIHVFYQNAEAKEFHFTGDLERYEHFDETLKMLEKATNVRFQINNDNVIVGIR